MLSNASKNTTEVNRTAKEISNILSNALAHTPVLSGSVQGFTEYTFLGFPCRTPLQLNNILGPTYWRVFHPVLMSIIEELKTSEKIDKSQLYTTLLAKYLGIMDLTQKLAFSNAPNAFNSIPSEQQEDYWLQINFLQPFRLFGITESNRKFQSDDLLTRNREWLWRANGNDSAPLFRKIIQIYILSSIIDDYQEAGTDPLLKNELVATNLKNIKLLHTELLQNLPAETNQLFQDINQTVEGNFLNSPNGFMEDNTINQLIDREFPGYMDMGSFYSGFRLMFGQPNIEPHHASAAQDINFSQARWHTYLHYTVTWLFLHLNISTSYFWLKSAFSIFARNWKALKNYIKNPESEIRGLLLQSLLFIPNAFILVCTPLLILFPGLYGLTSIPFSLIRSFCMQGPFRSLRNYKLLKGLDVVEFIKDGYLFFIYAIPMFGIMLTSVVGFIPEVLLTAGFFTAWIFIFIIQLSFSRNGSALIFEEISAAASTDFMQFFGASLFSSVVAYLGVGIISRRIYPYIPQSVFQAFDGVSRFLDRVSGLVEWCVHKFIGEPKINLQGLIPKSNLQAAIEMPKVHDKLILSEEMQKEIETVYKQLGKLNTSLHLSPERKTGIKRCMENLDISKAGSLESLKKAVDAAQEILQNNFDAAEATVMQNLITYLKDKQVAVSPAENASIRQHGNAGSYQPSWKMLQTLHEQGLINEQGIWVPPAGFVITPKMQEKCRRIESRAVG